jgi:pimeloyl-ACP methyl ester carboxylesterase
VLTGPSMNDLDSMTYYGNTVSIMATPSDPDVHPDSRFAAVDGIEMHYKRGGTGSPVILLHGSGSSLYGVEAVAERLQSSADAIRPDLPGFGVTGPRLDGDYGVQTYASTVARFLDAIDVSRCAVVGNSLGGNIAWNFFALDYPGRVTALVLINATGYPEKELPAGMALLRDPELAQILRKEMPREAVANSLRKAAEPNSMIIDDATIDRAHRLWNRPGNPGAFVDVVNTDQPDRSTDIPAIAVPTLVLRSAGMDGQHFGRDISGSVEKAHPHGGHLLPQEDPRWVADAVTDFLANLAANEHGR